MNKLRLYLQVYSWLHMLYCEFLVRMKWGCHLKIKNTLRCNLRCEYCVVSLPEGDRATFEELTAKEWLQIIDNFPLRVRVLVLIGGESFIRPDSIDLINGCVERRIVIKILTNQTYKRMLKVKPSPYVKFLSTYHPQVKFDYWFSHWRKIKSMYRTRAFEIAPEKQMIKGSKIFPMVCSTDDGAYFRRDWIFAPNGEFVFSLIDLYEMRGHHPKKVWRFKE